MQNGKKKNQRIQCISWTTVAPVWVLKNTGIMYLSGCAITGNSGITKGVRLK